MNFNVTFLKTGFSAQFTHQLLETWARRLNTFYSLTGDREESGLTSSSIWTNKLIHLATNSSSCPNKNKSHQIKVDKIECLHLQISPWFLGQFVYLIPKEHEFGSQECSFKNFYYHFWVTYVCSLGGGYSGKWVLHKRTKGDSHR